MQRLQHRISIAGSRTGPGHQIRSRVLLHHLLMAVAFVAGGIPWYALQAVPVVRVGGAKVHVLDLLVAAAMLTGAVALSRTVRRAKWLAVSIVMFVGYMTILMAIALGRRDEAFVAIREFRALAYYAIGVVVVLAGFTWQEHRRLLGAWLAGAVIGVTAAMLHLHLLVPLPGYPVGAVGSAQFGTIMSIGWGERISLEPTVNVIAAGYRINYLEWTAVLVAFLLATAGLLGAREMARKSIYGSVLLGLIWYQLASAGRAVQFLSLLGGLMLVAALAGRRTKALAAAGVLAAVLAAGIGMRAPSLIPPSIRVPIQSTVLRWVQLPADDSLRVRLKELMTGFPAFRRSPVIGVGLGSQLAVPVQSDPSGVAPNIASGYGFLLFKTGVIGLGLYLLIMGVTLVLAYRQTRATRGAPASVVAWVATIGTASLLALNSVHKVADIPEGAIAFALFAGIATMPRSHGEMP